MTDEQNMDVNNMSKPQLREEVLRLQRCYDSVAKHRDETVAELQRVQGLKQRKADISRNDFIADLTELIEDWQHEGIEVSTNKAVEIARYIEIGGEWYSQAYVNGLLSNANSSGVDRGLRTMIQKMDDYLRTEWRAELSELARAMEKTFDAVSEHDKRQTEFMARQDKLSAKVIASDARVEKMLNQPVDRDEAAALKQIKECLGEDWVNVECDGDIVTGVAVMKAQLDVYEEKVKAAGPILARLAEQFGLVWHA